MTTLEKIRIEILDIFLWEGQTEETLNSSVRKCLEIIDKYAEQEPTDNKLSFPNTFDEFVEQYGITDTDEVYTNGSKLIPTFRVKQWLAEQEPCENCDYSEIMDWEQDAKTGKAKPIYWCERHKEPCDDVVSREAVIEWLKAKDIIKMSSQEEMARKELKALPSVRQQEPKTGHWIKYGKLYQCSECKELSCCQGKFCNDCGARMVEPRESEDKE